MALPLLVLGGCDLGLEKPILERVQKRGSIIVVTRNAPTTYFELRDQTVGFEHDLAVSFARYLGVTPRFVIRHNDGEIYAALDRGEGDFAAAGLVLTLEAARGHLFGPVYQEVEQQVVCRRGRKRPEDLLELAGLDLVVAGGGSLEERMRELQALVPELTWRTDPDASAEQLLEAVQRGTIDCTVADSNVVTINRRHFPELVVAMSLSGNLNLAWALPRRAVFLRREMEKWFNLIQQNGTFAELFERYYGHLQEDPFDYVENRSFHQRLASRLPQYQGLFQEAEQRSGFSWALLAAQSYQESHWNPKATSPTGVRGLMMLTLNTSRDLGVRNRLDPRQSILAGARYLLSIHRRLPEGIKEPDRTWIALAAYNVGLGHVRDARLLAERLGRNPNLWRELREVLPLLAYRKYFKDLPHGYARGWEPVRYVRNIRRYLDILYQKEAFPTQEVLTVEAEGTEPAPEATPQAAVEQGIGQREGASPVVASALAAPPRQAVPAVETQAGGAMVSSSREEGGTGPGTPQPLARAMGDETPTTGMATKGQAVPEDKPEESHPPRPPSAGPLPPTETPPPAASPPAG